MVPAADSGNSSCTMMSCYIGTSRGTSSYTVNVTRMMAAQRLACLDHLAHGFNLIFVRSTEERTGAGADGVGTLRRQAWPKADSVS